MRTTAARTDPLAQRTGRTAAQQLHATLQILAQTPAGEASEQVVADARRRHAREMADSPVAHLRVCQSGCSFCCYAAAVDVTPPEALSIARYVDEELPSAQQRDVRDRLEENARLHRDFSSSQRARARLRCAFLSEDETCSIYAARPLACAGASSLSRSACQQAFFDIENLSARIPVDRPAQAATCGISGGMQHALSQSNLDSNLYELHSAVTRALETSDAADRWAQGEDIFAGCVCTDAHSPPRRRVDGPEAPRPKMQQSPARNSGGQVAVRPGDGPAPHFL
jgi:hypothetical protein